MVSEVRQDLSKTRPLTTPTKVASQRVSATPSRRPVATPLSPQLPALPRRLRGRRRADGAVPVSAAPRLSQRNLQVHLDRQRQAKPDRERPGRTIKNGLHGTSMPAFDALMTPPRSSRSSITSSS